MMTWRKFFLFRDERQFRVHIKKFPRNKSSFGFTIGGKIVDNWKIFDSLGINHRKQRFDVWFMINDWNRRLSRNLGATVSLKSDSEQRTNRLKLSVVASRRISFDPSLQLQARKKKSAESNKVAQRHVRSHQQDSFWFISAPSEKFHRTRCKRSRSSRAATRRLSRADDTWKWVKFLCCNSTRGASGR